MIQTSVSNRDMKYLSLAAKVAAKSAAHERHGCVVVSGGRPISMAVNNYINDWHAEAKAVFNLKCVGATLYVARLRKEQPVGMSAPCPECLAAIRKAGIRRVVLHDQRP